VKAWTKATRFLGSMRSHRSPTIRGHRRAGPSPTRPPAAAQIRVICARSAVREAYPQEASKFAKVVKTTRDGRQLTRRYFALGDTDPIEGPTTGGAACSGAHPQGCPPDCAGPPPRSAALPGPGGRRARDRLRSGPAQGDPAVPVAVPHPGGAAASRANRDRHGTVRRRPRARRSMRADRPWDCPALATCCSTAVPTWSGSGPATSPTPTSRPWPPSTPPRTARTAGWPVSRSLAPPRCWTPSGCLRCELPHPPWVAMMTSPLRRLPVQGCLDGAGNGKHDPKQRPETHDPVGRGEQRHEHGKHAEKDGLTAVPARRRYRLCQSQLHEDTSSETVSAHETVSAQWTAALLPPPVRGSARRDHWPARTPHFGGVRARRRTRKPCGKRSPGSSPGWAYSCRRRRP